MSSLGKSEEGTSVGGGGRNSRKINVLKYYHF